MLFSWETKASGCNTPLIEGVKQTGRGFRNGKFVQKLRQIVSEIPTVDMIEGTVKELLETPDESQIYGFRCRPKGEKNLIDIKAHLTVVSDGFFSIFRDQLSQNNKEIGSFFLGLILKSPELPYRNHGTRVHRQPIAVPRLPHYRN